MKHIACILLGSLSLTSCGLINSLLSIPVRTLKSVGRTVGVTDASDAEGTQESAAPELDGTRLVTTEKVAD